MVLYTRRARAVRRVSAAAANGQTHSSARCGRGRQRQRLPPKSRRCPRRAPRKPRLLHAPKTRNTTANVGLRVKVHHCGSGLGAVSSATNAAFRAELKLAAQARPFHSQAAPRAKRAEYPHLDEQAAARRVAACGFNTTVWRTPWRCGNMARLARARYLRDTRAVPNDRAQRVTDFGARRAR